MRKYGSKSDPGSYLAENKIEPEVVQNMRGWEHSGFSVDQSVLLQPVTIEPLQREVIEKILKHYRLWQAYSARPPPAAAEGGP